MCAMTAAQRGRRVMLLEKSNKPGKKILMSGGGRCNFTNLYVTAENFVSHNPHFCKSALQQYTQWDFIALVEKHGIAYHEKTAGQLFCDDSSRAILNMLLQECDRAGVTIITRCEVQAVQAQHGYRLNTTQGEFHTDSLVIATGGLSIPSLGGSDFGYRLAQQFDLRVWPRQAGLVPFTFSEPLKSLFSHLAGLSLPVSATSGDICFQNDMLFTHRGLSGPVMLQLSNYWQPGTPIILDLLPGQDVRTLLSEAKQSQPRLKLRSVLDAWLPRKLVLSLETLWWPERSETALAEWPDKHLQQIATQLTHWEIKPAGTEGYRTAEVTLGGVDTDALSSRTMECKTHPGLYFIGEVVDVTGQLGGFNFQWAWSSGYVAGLHV